MSDNGQANQDNDARPFSGPQLQNGEFTNADMTGTNFDGVNLAKARFYAVLRDAVFDDSDLSSAVFNDVNLAGATFDNVNLKGSKFHNIDLSGTSFDYLNMRDVEVTRADLTGMTIDGIPVSEFIAAYREKHGISLENDGSSDQENQMFEAAAHAPLSGKGWSETEAQREIDDIVKDALNNFDETSFWRAHPQDNGTRKGETGIYLGATGVIWAMEHLKRTGATTVALDFSPVVERLVDATQRQFREFEYRDHGSLHFGDLGALLLAMGLAPEPATADAVFARASANSELPIRELMWGLPGSMLACLFMDEMTGESRWQALFRDQAARLLGELEETEAGPLWTQDLYETERRWLGPVHGYAGNMIPLLRGWDWLDEDQRAVVADAVPRTLEANAILAESGAQWLPSTDAEPPLRLCQHCHGAPGMVSVFADSPFSTPGLEKLLVAGAELTWLAGPLAKGSNLCHGTGGNGYAFLKLYRRTGEEKWLERARAFAMTAIEQCRAARTSYGRGRYSLWTGDPGLACYLHDCLTAEPRFPTVDVF